MVSYFWVYDFSTLVIGFSTLHDTGLFFKLKKPKILKISSKIMVNDTTFQLTFEWKKNFKNSFHFQEANKSLKNKTSLAKRRTS